MASNKWAKFSNFEDGSLSWVGSKNEVLWVLKQKNNTWKVFIEFGMGKFETIGFFSTKKSAIKRAAVYRRTH